ncbi:glycosyltransferase family 4 protein [Sphingomonas nostoxanthinifaciens]|uniref:glycosyltransferase family 4 protein n=1 Tax=Sphingomonas nostoxanthinifaciens TaxID=2872652 RepID=UPI001CC1FD87|nr:glycosyltransferase family 1 protein [Sphingomonas nostoxanthinifaciens]UAK25075.1 glycosyltransferase family 1 protein [Sphingomonas nostoxanthinifaciens]
MKIALVSDAWAPQVNGVVRTLATTVAKLAERRHRVETITPDGFRTVPCPSYPEIRLALGCGAEVARRLAAFDPDAIHIATEGPLGWAARRWCIAHELPFTTSFHTRFPDYVAMRTGLPTAWFWPVVRRFHRPAHRIMVATEGLAAELRTQGLGQTTRWSRGVDTALFAPDAAPHPALIDLPRPIQLYVGRLAVEKNLDAFLAADTPGTKVLVGDGPAAAALARAFPQAKLLGALQGEALAGAYAAADVFVFPSRTDTFGLVMIEALASGTPVAGYPVHGPLDIVGRDGRGTRGQVIGALDDDLAVAIGRALDAAPSACAAEGRSYSWDACTDQFIGALQPISRRLQAMAA